MGFEFEGEVVNLGVEVMVDLILKNEEINCGRLVTILRVN